jgi:translation elongation factor P/translation initiation factor 5A
MAAPASVNIQNLTGTWTLNKKLSDPVDKGLGIQGVGFVIRKAIGAATIKIELKQSSAGGVTKIESDQSAAGLKPTHEERTLDGVPKKGSDWIFGDTESSTTFVKQEEITDEFLKKGWLPEGDLIQNTITSDKNGWKAVQVWGFMNVNGERRHIRKLLVTKGKDRAEARLAYDYVA